MSDKNSQKKLGIILLPKFSHSSYCKWQSSFSKLNFFMCKKKGKFIIFEKLDCNLQYWNVNFLYINCEKEQLKCYQV
jgi:hypothetical protein